MDKISYLNGFITKNNISNKNTYDGGLLFNDKFDEPTYLSIRVDFFPDVVDKHDNKSIEYNNPFENNLKTTNYNIMPCPLLDKNGDYSTIKYLKDSIGDVYRAHLLDKLINGLYDLSAHCPYYITSIDGINSLLTVDPKRGSRIKSDTVITLKCMEGLDQRISAIKNLYKKIAWDDTYQRWILPDMMRYFKMNIYITEFRVFHTNDNIVYTDAQLPDYAKTAAAGMNMNAVRDAINSANPIKFEKYNDYKFLNRRMPTTVLTCSMCEFDISDAFSHLSSLSSAPKNNNLNDLEIKIKVGNIKEHSIYGLFGKEIHDNNEQNAYKDVISLNDITLSLTNYSAGGRQGVTYYDIEEKNKLIEEANINYYLRTNKLIEDNIVKKTKQSENYLKDIQTDIVSMAAPTPEDVQSTYFGRLIKNTAKDVLGWAKNHIKDQVIDIINKKIMAGSSLNDIRMAIKSENIFSMINIFKSNAENIKAEYPEVSSATNGNLDVAIFKEHLNTISKATSTDNENDGLKAVADYLLLYGEKTGANKIDDYMDALKDVLDIVPVSKATSIQQINKKILL